MPTTSHTRTVTELAAYLSDYYEHYETLKPALPGFETVARALGVAATCTGNPDTAADSVTHTPKSGLTVAFYSFNPGHHKSQELATAYYVASWRGEQYRGNVIVSDRSYHAQNKNGFVCTDIGTHWQQLPTGCRQLVAAIVTEALINSGVSLGQLNSERAEHTIYYRISAKLYDMKRGAEEAAAIANREQWAEYI